MNHIKTVFLASIAALSLGTHSAYAQSSKLTRIMGLGGVCSDCDLSKRNLSRARMNGASFPRSNFTGADLSYAQLRGSNFSRAIFRRTDLSNVDTEGSNFSRADFSGAALDKINARSVNLSHAILNGSKGNGAQFLNSHFTYTRMLGVWFQNSKFDTCDFTNTDFSGANFRQSTFVKSNMDRTRMGNVDFTDAHFDRVNFQNAKFGNAHLKNTKFTTTILAGADLSFVRNLTQKQLDQSCGSKQTRLPKGFTIVNCNTVPWAQGFADPYGNISYSFSTNLAPNEIARIQRDVQAAIQKRHQALHDAGLALADALEKADRQQIPFDWDFDEAQNQKWKRRASHRALSRTIRQLSELQLSTPKAQNEIKRAITALERAQVILDANKQDSAKTDR